MKAFGDFDHVDVPFDAAFAEASQNIAAIPDRAMVGDYYQCSAKGCAEGVDGDDELCQICLGERLTDEDIYDLAADRRADEGMHEARLAKAAALSHAWLKAGAR